MKKDIGFICVGQAGGNIGKLFENLGYSVLYINTSKEDLDTLKDPMHIYHIPNGEGCFKNRDAAKTLLANNLDPVIAEIKNKIKTKYLFFIFASSGGTGSGMSPFLMDILINEEFIDEFGNSTRTVGCIPIIPDKSETPTAKMNCNQCFKEISEISGMGNVFPLCNEIPENYGGDYDKYKFHINKKFVEAFDTFVSIPTKHKSTMGNIDKAEIKEMLKTPGMAVISITDKRTPMPKIIDSLKHSIFAPLETDPEKRKLRYIASSTVEPLNYESIKTEFGQFLDEFHTSNQEKNIVYMCGLRLPVTTISELRSSVDSIRKDLLRSSSDVIEDDVLKDDDFLNEIRKPKRKPRTQLVTDNSSQETTKTVSQSRRRLLDRYKQ